MKYSYSLSSLPLVSDGKQMTTLQHLSYQVKLTGVTCTDNASGYSAVVSLLPIVGVHPSLLTPNAEVHVFINNSTCINRHNMEIWKSTLGVFKTSNGMTLLSPRFDSLLSAGGQPLPNGIQLSLF